MTLKMGVVQNEVNIQCTVSYILLLMDIRCVRLLENGIIRTL